RHTLTVRGVDARHRPQRTASGILLAMSADDSVAEDRRWPRSVYGHGDEPDPRFSLANERTFLAWIRTSLGLLAGSVAVHLIDFDVDETIPKIAAALRALTGLACAAEAWRGWSKTERALREQRPLPSSRISIVVVGVVVVVAAGLAVLSVWG